MTESWRDRIIGVLARLRRCMVTWNLQLPTSKLQRNCKFQTSIRSEPEFPLQDFVAVAKRMSDSKIRNFISIVSSVVASLTHASPNNRQSVKMFEGTTMEGPQREGVGPKLTVSMMCQDASGCKLRVERVACRYEFFNTRTTCRISILGQMDTPPKFEHGTISRNVSVECVLPNDAKWRLFFGECHGGSG
jgi:hypothetical protein